MEGIERHQITRKLDWLTGEDMNRENEIKQFIQKLKKIERIGKEKFQIKECNSLQKLDKIKEENSGISEELRPSEFWFDKERYDEIYDMLDEVQTKTEDSIKSNKRIFKVWSPDVMQAHNVRFTIEYVEMLGDSMKILKTKFWKYKKLLKALFIEEESLYNDDEIKLLKKNMEIMTENDNWLFFKKRHIAEILGDNYKDKETDFNQMRKNYDKFYFWLIEQPGKCHVTQTEFSSFCEYLQELKKLHAQKFISLFVKTIPVFTKENVYQMSFDQMEQELLEYLELSGEINGVSEYRIKQYGFRQKEDKIYDKTADSVEQSIEWILKGEYSISVKELIRQCSRLLGQKRVTAKLKQEAEQFLNHALSEGYYLEDGFVISTNPELKQFFIAAANEKRDISLVSNAEMLYGVTKVIQAEREITLENLSKLISQMLGYPRRTSHVNASVEYAVKQLKTDGKIVRKSGGWCLLEREANTSCVNKK